MAIGNYLSAQRLLFCVLLSAAASGTCSAHNIGVLLPGEGATLLQEAAVKAAVERASAGRLAAVTHTLAHQRPLVIAQAVCSLLDQGVVAIIDGTTATSQDSTLASLCEMYSVPCFSLHPHSDPTHEDTETNVDKFTVNMQPPTSIIAEASASVVRALHWSNVTVVYDTLDHLAVAEDLLTDQHLHLTITKLDRKQNIRRALQDIEQRNDGALLALRPALLKSFLAAAAPSGGAAAYTRKYFVPGSESTDELLRHLPLKEGAVVALTLASIDAHPRNSVEQLLQDAVQVAAAAASAAGGARLQEEQDLCRLKQPWSQGRRMMAAIVASRVEGVTGGVQFSADGTRSNVTLKVLLLSPQGVTETARWRASDGAVVWPAGPSHPARGPVAGGRVERALTGSKGGRIQVTLVLSEPYVMLREPRRVAVNSSSGGDNETTEGEMQLEELHGNDRYEGIAVDLFQMVADKLNFEYDLHETADGKYGGKNTGTGKWTGMIGDLVRQDADVAIGDISVSRGREVLDYTQPWITSGIGVLMYREPEHNLLDVYTLLLLPFSTELWLAILATCAALALLLFLIARLSPMEREDAPAETSLTCCNSVWFAAATLCRQVTAVQPRAASTRVLSLAWWLLVLAVVASYIANLSSILALQAMPSERTIKSVYDLPSQDHVTYTAINGGTTWYFLQNSESETLQRIYANIIREELATPAIKSTKDGVDYVLSQEGRAAFLMEVPAIEYFIERNCNLKRLPGIIGEVNYAFALQKSSPLRSRLYNALQEMISDGSVAMLQERWWKQKRGGGQCYNRPPAGESRVAISLDPEVLVIPWLILAVAAVAAIVVALVECCCRSFTHARIHDSGICTEMGDQFRGAIVGPTSGEGCHDNRI